jgi:hypothetical protein
LLRDNGATTAPCPGAPPIAVRTNDHQSPRSRAERPIAFRVLLLEIRYPLGSPFPRPSGLPGDGSDIIRVATRLWRDRVRPSGSPKHRWQLALEAAHTASRNSTPALPIAGTRSLLLLRPRRNFVRCVIVFAGLFSITGLTLTCALRSRTNSCYTTSTNVSRSPA